MIENQRSPVMTHKIHEGPAHCLAPHPEGFLMCVGGDTGDLAMINLSASLVDVTKAEKVTVATMLDRETRREKILSTLRKEDRLKSKAKNKMKMFISGGMMKKVKLTEMLKAEIYQMFIIINISGFGGGWPGSREPTIWTDFNFQL